MSRKKYPEPKQQVTFQMPLNDFAEANTYAVEHNMTFSDLARTAIRDYMQYRRDVDPFQTPKVDGSISLALSDGDLRSERVPIKGIADEIRAQDSQIERPEVDIFKLLDHANKKT